jgi:hypothetical protein
MIYW